MTMKDGPSESPHQLFTASLAPSLPGLARSARQPPVDAHEISRFVEMHVERAVKGAPQRLAETTRQMDVGRRDDQPVLRVLDADDAIKGMFALLGGFLVAREAGDFRRMLPRERAMHGDDAGGEALGDAAACRARLLVRLDRPLPPLPPAMMIDRAALRTGGRLLELMRCLIGVEDMILLGAPIDAAPRPTRVLRLRHGFHLGSSVCFDKHSRGATRGPL